MRRVLATALLLAGLSVSAQTPVQIKVWPDGAPNSNGITTPENNIDETRVGNVSDPVMYVYPADASKNTGAALVVCPGGGYVRLSMDYEGHDIAKWLASNGITGIVLKYRMPNGHHDVPLSDAQQTMRIVRARAAEWGVDPKKVGVSGFSAGGHLASTLATHFDAESRPDFAVLFYPVVSLDPAIAHGGSRTSLLGREPSQEMVDLYSNEKQVTAQTPPTLLFHSDDDRTVPTLNSTRFYEALKANRVPASIYVFPIGGHGWGFRSTYKYHEEWKNLLLKWLEDNKIMING